MISFRTKFLSLSALGAALVGCNVAQNAQPPTWAGQNVAGVALAGASPMPGQSSWSCTIQITSPSGTGNGAGTCGTGTAPNGAISCQITPPGGGTTVGWCVSNPSMTATAPASQTPFVMPSPTQPPIIAPSVSPSPAGGATTQVLSVATLGGSPGFITSGSKTVYTFDADTQTNVSTCSGACLVVWPPVAPPTMTLSAPWSSFTRQDGSQQLAYKGAPLYTYIGDAAAGDVKGDAMNSFGALWHIARP